MIRSPLSVHRTKCAPQTLLCAFLRAASAEPGTIWPGLSLLSRRALVWRPCSIGNPREPCSNRSSFSGLLSGLKPQQARNMSILFHITDPSRVSFRAGVGWALELSSAVTTPSTTFVVARLLHAHESRTPTMENSRPIPSQSQCSGSVARLGGRDRGPQT